MRKSVRLLSIFSFILILSLSYMTLAKPLGTREPEKTLDNVIFSIPDDAIKLEDAKIDSIYKKNGMYFTKNDSLNIKSRAEDIRSVVEKYIDYYKVDNSQINISYQNFTNLGGTEYYETPLWIVTLKGVDIRVSGGNPFGKGESVECDNSETKIFINDETNEIVHMISMRYNNKD